VDAGFYTRWGRTTCPPDNIAIYTGYMVTEYDLASGGGHNILCANDNPEWVRVNQNTAIDRGTGLRGIRYFFGSGYSNNLPFSYENNNNQKIDNNTAPCVMCYSPRSDSAMFTGFFNCPGDLTTEYSGFIVANHWKLQPSEFICLDQAPEVRQRGAGNFENEPSLSIARFVCSTLPCPNYVKFNQASCAVCSV